MEYGGFKKNWGVLAGCLRDKDDNILGSVFGSLELLYRDHSPTKNQ